MVGTEKLACWSLCVCDCVCAWVGGCGCEPKRKTVQFYPLIIQTLPRVIWLSELSGKASPSPPTKWNKRNSPHPSDHRAGWTSLSACSRFISAWWSFCSRNRTSAVFLIIIHTWRDTVSSLSSGCSSAQQTRLSANVTLPLLTYLTAQFSTLSHNFPGSQVDRLQFITTTKTLWWGPVKGPRSHDSKKPRLCFISSISSLLSRSGYVKFMSREIKMLLHISLTCLHLCNYLFLTWIF